MNVCHVCYAYAYCTYITCMYVCMYVCTVCMSCMYVNLFQRGCPLWPIPNSLLNALTYKCNVCMHICMYCTFALNENLKLQPISSGNIAVRIPIFSLNNREIWTLLFKSPFTPLLWLWKKPLRCNWIFRWVSSSEKKKVFWKLWPTLTLTSQKNTIS